MRVYACLERRIYIGANKSKFGTLVPLGLTSYMACRGKIFEPTELNMEIDKTGELIIGH